MVMGHFNYWYVFCSHFQHDSSTNSAKTLDNVRNGLILWGRFGGIPLIDRPRKGISLKSPLSFTLTSDCLWLWTEYSFYFRSRKLKIIWNDESGKVTDNFTDVKFNLEESQSEKNGTLCPLPHSHELRKRLHTSRVGMLKEIRPWSH